MKEVLYLPGSSVPACIILLISPKMFILCIGYEDLHDIKMLLEDSAALDIQVPEMSSVTTKDASDRAGSPPSEIYVFWRILNLGSSWYNLNQYLSFLWKVCAEKGKEIEWVFRWLTTDLTSIFASLDWQKVSWNHRNGYHLSHALCFCTGSAAWISFEL